MGIECSIFKSLQSYTLAVEMIERIWNLKPVHNLAYINDNY